MDDGKTGLRFAKQMRNAMALRFYKELCSKTFIKTSRVKKFTAGLLVKTHSTAEWALAKWQSHYSQERISLSLEKRCGCYHQKDQ